MNQHFLSKSGQSFSLTKVIRNCTSDFQESKKSNLVHANYWIAIHAIVIQQWTSPNYPFCLRIIKEIFNCNFAILPISKENGIIKNEENNIHHKCSMCTGRTSFFVKRSFFICLKNSIVWKLLPFPHFSHDKSVKILPVKSSHFSHDLLTSQSNLTKVGHISVQLWLTGLVTA